MRPANNRNEFKERRAFLKEEIDRKIKIMQKQRKIEKELNDKEEFVNRVCNRCEEVKKESPRNESHIAKMCARCESEKLEFSRIREDLMKEYSEEAHKNMVQYNKNLAEFILADEAAEAAAEAAAKVAARAEARAAAEAAEEAVANADERLRMARLEQNEALAEQARVLAAIQPPKKSWLPSWFKGKGGRKTRRHMKKSKGTRRK